MPTYQYACTTCGHELEAVQSFADDPLTECPVCEGRLRKQFGSVGIVFKGPGFYRTDSRAGANGNGKADKGDGADSKGEKSTSGDSKPAETSGSKDGGSKDGGSKDSGSKTSGSKDGGSKTSTGKTTAGATSASS